MRKHTIDGRVFEIIQPLNSAVLCRQIYETDGWDGERLEHEGPLALILESQLFSSPPTEKLADQIVSLNETVNGLKSERDKIIKEIEEIKHDAANRMGRLTARKELEMLQGFVDGKITHYVECPNWSHDVKITKFEEAVCGSDKRELKLLTLFGNSKGQLDWRLNDYKDGSGGYSKVVPCTSESDARQIAVAILSERVNAADARPNTELLNACLKWGVPVPDSFSVATAKARKAETQKTIENLERQLAVERARLAS